MALIRSSAERIRVLIRLAGIALYLGGFSKAQRYGRAALDLASTPDASLRARCYGIVAATEYSGGDIPAAGTRSGDALDLPEDMPGAGRDRIIHSTIPASLGTAAETRQQRATAEHHHPSLVLAVAADEAREAAQAVTTGPQLAGMLAQVSAGTWEPPASGITLHPYETVTAVLLCATRAPSLRSGLVSAVQPGGDTDTVAALVGGLTGSKLTTGQVRAELPWHRPVTLPEPESAIAETAAALATARAIQPT